jgi:hypothetical protein
MAHISEIFLWERLHFRVTQLGNKSSLQPGVSAMSCGRDVYQWYVVCLRLYLSTSGLPPVPVLQTSKLSGPDDDQRGFLFHSNPRVPFP